MNQQLASRVIVAVVGETGSGKTTLITDLATQIQAPVVAFGGYVRQEAQRRGISVDRPTLQSLGQELIATHGDEDFARQVIASIPGPHDILLVDGIRSVGVWKAVRAMTQMSLLVYLDVPSTIRAARVAKRDQQGREQVLKVLQHPLEQGIRELRDIADFVVGVTNLDEVVARIILIVKER